MGSPGRRAAQVALALAIAVFAPARARADAPIGCAGDGAPHQPFEPTGYLSGQGVLTDGHDAQLTAGDLAEGTGFQPLTVRFGLCGRLAVKIGHISYDIVYEPYDRFERAHVDADSWGRMATAEIGWQPLRWLGIYAGVRKVLFSFGHDEPLQARALPLPPLLDAQLAPDRRLGLTFDVDFGAIRLIAGGYESARTLNEIGDGGVLVAARGIIEPIGPVGPALSTVGDRPVWRRRARFGIDLSLAYEWTPEVSGWAAGADLPFKIGPLGFVVEYLFARNLLIEGPFAQPVPRVSRQGAWAEAALMLWRPYLELAARYEWQDVPNFPREQFQAVTAGLNLYLYHRYARAQIVYTHRFFLRTLGLDDENLALVVLTLAR